MLSAESKTASRLPSPRYLRFFTLMGLSALALYSMNAHFELFAKTTGRTALSTLNTEERREESRNNVKPVREGESEEQTLQRLLEDEENLKVISMSLYGNSWRYIGGALENAALTRTVFPGWRLVFYTPCRTCDNALEDTAITKLQELGAELRTIPGGSPLAGSGGMLWRFQPALEPNVAYAIFRDADSRLTFREWAAVQEWIASEKPFHVIRDHPSHSNYPVSGGLWGVRRGVLDATHLLGGIGYGGAYLADMNFINEKLWPTMVKQGVFQHDSFSCGRYIGGEPFLTPRKGLEHIGGVFSTGAAADGLRREDTDILQHNLPSQKPCCRDDITFLIWSIDVQGAMYQDLRSVLKPLGSVRLLDKSLCEFLISPFRCEEVGDGSKALTTDRFLLENLEELRETFYRTNKDLPEIRDVDAFGCFDPPAMCELFMQFRKPLLVVASVRYDAYRRSQALWERWHGNLLEINEGSSIPGSVVAANSVYDQKYLEYFTGLEVPVLSSVCGACPEARYRFHHESSVAVQIGSSDGRIWNEGGVALYNELVKASKLKFVVLDAEWRQSLRKTIPNGDGDYEKLARRHAAIVHLPSQVSSVTSFFEHYWMGIPLAFPDRKLLTDWNIRFGTPFMQRTWKMVPPTNATVVSPTEEDRGGFQPPRFSFSMEQQKSASWLRAFDFDPNDGLTWEAVHEWLRFADFYQWPHLFLFNSWPHLVSLLEAADAPELSAMSLRMRAHALRIQTEQRRRWIQILRGVRHERDQRAGLDCHRRIAKPKLLHWYKCEKIWTRSCPNVGNFYQTHDLADCKEKCETLPECTAINVNPSLPDCVLRGCDQGDIPDVEKEGYTGYATYAAPGCTLVESPKATSSEQQKLIQSDLIIGSHEEFWYSGENMTELQHNTVYNGELFTLDFTVKPAGSIVNGIRFQSLVTSRDHFRGYMVYFLPESKQYHVQWGIGDTWNTLDVSPEGGVLDWARITVSYDGTTMRVYLNGILQAEQVTGFTPNTVRPLRIGAGATESNPQFFYRGSIKRIQIYNSVKEPCTQSNTFLSTASASCEEAP